jgi:hypothetical protein
MAQCLTTVRVTSERENTPRTVTAPRSGLALSEFPDERFEPVEPGRSIFQWVLLGGLLLAATVGWILASRRIEAPWIMGDELTYSEHAKSFADSGEFLFREEPARYLSIYPALISPAWLADSVETAYSLAKAINVVLMVSAAIPLYLWARRLVTPGFALLAVVLMLVMPSFVYTGNVMTESAFLPAFLLATFAVALVLERPTALRQLGAMAAIALAVLLRLQAFVFLLIVPTAVVLKALLDVRADGQPIRPRPLVQLLKPFAPAALAGGAVLVAYVLYSTTRGEGLDWALAAYKEIPHADYSAAEILRWTLTHLGELSLSVGVLPVSALVVLLALAWQRASSFTPAQRAFLAVTAAAGLWMVLQVATFASEHSLRIEERNMFYLAPLLFLALVLWLARGLPRPRRTTAVAVLLPTALLVSIPLESLFNVSVRNDTFGLVPFFRLNDLLSGGVHDVRIVLVVGALGAGLMFAALPRWLMALAIPAGVAAFLLLSAYSVSGGAKVQSHAKRIAYALGPDPNWIDDSIGPDGNAAFLFTPEMGADPDVVAQAEFWNRSVRDVYDFGAPAFVFPGDDVAANPTTGIIAGADGRPLSSAPYAVIDAARVGLAGDLISRSGPLGLFRLDGPARITSRSEGIYADRWSGPDASYSQYWNPGNTPGRIRIELSRAGVGEQVPPTVVRMAVKPLPEAEGRPFDAKNETIRAGDVRAVTLSTPRPPFRAYVHVDTTFTPTDYGQPDARQLGVRVVFRFKPR